MRQLFLLNIVMKQHTTLKHTTHLIGKRRGHSVCARFVHPKTSFMRRFYPFLGSFVYNKINEVINIYTLNKINLKKSVSRWLGYLSYDETESLITVLQ